MSLFYNLNESKATENVTMKWPSDEYIIPAGTPMSRTGIANNGDAIGILAREARIEFPYPLSIAHLIGKKEPKGNQDFTFTLITGGYVNLEEVEAAFGGEISEEAKAAMSDIVFVKKNIDLGGGGSGGGMVEILPEMNLFDEFGDGLFRIDKQPGLEIGKNYTVKYNGVEYSCVAMDGSEVGESGDIYLGNTGAMTGGTDSGEPFIFVEAIGTGVCILIMLDGATSVTISIKGKATGGGSAEIPTCTMRFKNGSDVQHNGSYSYTKYENGVMSLVSVETYEYLSEFDITLENVVCDSIVIFGWMYMGDWGNIAVDGNARLLTDGMGSPNETSIFGSPTAAGEVCTIELQSGSDFGDEW